MTNGVSPLKSEPAFYFVTGDYVVGGVGLQGKGGASGWATGTIVIDFKKMSGPWIHLGLKTCVVGMLQVSG